MDHRLCSLRHEQQVISHVCGATWVLKFLIFQNHLSRINDEEVTVHDMPTSIGYNTLGKAANHSEP